MAKKIIDLVAAGAVAASLAVFALHGQTQPKFEPPLLVTSAGQSADVSIAAMLAKKAELSATLSKLASGRDLENHKTLVLVLGASMKGLGSAGLDADKEFARIRGLLTEAQKRSLGVLCLHLGGEQRRGELTDKIIRECLPSAKAAIVVKSGNKDGLFTKICGDHKVLLIEVEKTIDVIAPQKAMFGE